MTKRPERHHFKIEKDFFNDFNEYFIQIIKNLARAIKTANKIQGLEIADPEFDILKEFSS